MALTTLRRPIWEMTSVAELDAALAEAAVSEEEMELHNPQLVWMRARVAEAIADLQARGIYDEHGQLTGTYYVHLGSTLCPDATRGKRRSAVAEHELAHALGLATHFDEFTGNEGVSPERVRSVLYSLYRNPIGAPLDSIQSFGSPSR